MKIFDVKWKIIFSYIIIWSKFISSENLSKYSADVRSYYMNKVLNVHRKGRWSPAHNKLLSITLTMSSYNKWMCFQSPFYNGCYMCSVQTPAEVMQHNHAAQKFHEAAMHSPASWSSLRGILSSQTAWDLR